MADLSELSFSETFVCLSTHIFSNACYAPGGFSQSGCSCLGHCSRQHQVTNHSARATWALAGTPAIFATFCGDLRGGVGSSEGKPWAAPRGDARFLGPGSTGSVLRANPTLASPGWEAMQKSWAWDTGVLGKLEPYILLTFSILYLVQERKVIKISLQSL